MQDDLLKHDLSRKDLISILHELTGHIYTFATSSDMRWGKDGKVENMGVEFPDGFYQVMPHTLDDGFFDWYCYHREDQQFFAFKETAALHFIFYWLQWNKLGKPKPF